MEHKPVSRFSRLRDVEPPGYDGDYVHKSLESGSIRLLILGKAENYDDDLHCDIMQVSLSEQTLYTALSYAWGTAPSSHALHVEGNQPMRIGTNLNSALRHLRRRDREMWLWVDAVCINQRDISERNHQVGQMRRIYESAARTVIYLGDENGNTTLSAWNFLERNSSWALDEDQDEDFERPVRMEELVDFRGGMDDVSLDVLSREWFSRVWVLQEVVVSSCVSIRCGARGIPWDDFCRTVLQHRQVHDSYGWRIQQQERLEAVSRMWQARVAFHVSRGQESCLAPWYKEISTEQASTDVLSMLFRARFLMATDSRDKIFAILGISTGFDWQALGTIDYEKNTEEVYLTFAKDLMTMKGDYRALSYLNSAATLEYLSMRRNSWLEERERVGSAKLSKAQELMKQPSEGFRKELLKSGRDRSLVRRIMSRAGVESFRKPFHLTRGSKRAEEETPPEDVALVAAASAVTLQENTAFNTIHVIPPEDNDQDHFEIDDGAESQRQIDHMYDVLVRYCALGWLDLPSWVPNWQCLASANFEPSRPIVETFRPRDTEAKNENNNVDDFRTWSFSNDLVVHGRIIGALDDVVSSASLLGRDEAVFEDLKEKWQQTPRYQKYPLDSQILTLWAHLLDEAAFTRQDHEPEGMNVASLSPELYRSRRYDVDELLSNPPGSIYKGAKNSFSFLEYLDIQRSPPVPGSIEEHLVARARKTAQWSDAPIAKVMNDRASVIDQRLLGTFTPINDVDGQADSDVDGQSGSHARSAPGLVLLPSAAKLDDIMVYFPGAEVPFIVRPGESMFLEESQLSEDVRNDFIPKGSLPFLVGDEWYVECELIGECWFDGFPEAVASESENGFVFHIV